MKRSESIIELATALAKAQGEFTAAERDHTAKVQTRKGGEYTFNYADLASFLDVCREPLSKNGLSIIQEPIREGDVVTVTTTLFHSSGQFLETEPLKMNIISQGEGDVITPQAVGSAITYARRYALSSFIGMASEVDDDGNTASGNKADTGKREAAPNCPKCGTNANVIRGKPEFGGGWLCWNKPASGKHGCGEKWQDEAKPATVDADLRKSTFAVLEKAASLGVVNFGKVFQGLTEEERKSVINDLDKLKAQARTADIAMSVDRWKTKIADKPIEAINGEVMTEIFNLPKGEEKDAIWAMMQAALQDGGYKYNSKDKKFVVA